MFASKSPSHSDSAGVTTWFPGRIPSHSILIPFLYHLGSSITWDPEASPSFYRAIPFSHISSCTWFQSPLCSSNSSGGRWDKRAFRRSTVLLGAGAFRGRMEADSSRSGPGRRRRGLREQGTYPLTTNEVASKRRDRPKLAPQEAQSEAEPSSSAPAPEGPLVVCLIFIQMFYVYVNIGVYVSYNSYPYTQVLSIIYSLNDMQYICYMYSYIYEREMYTS